MCFSVEASSSVGSKRNYTLYTHTHIYKYISVASGSWFIITIVIRGHSPLGRPKVFSVLLLLKYYSFFPSFLHACVCVCSAVCTCVYTVSSLHRKSSEHTSLISHFRYAHTQTQKHTRVTWRPAVLYSVQ